MRSFVVIVLLVVVLVSTSVSGGERNQNDKGISRHHTESGTTCRYTEMKQGGRKRGLQICSCKEQVGKKDKQKQKVKKGRKGNNGKKGNKGGKEPEEKKTMPCCEYYGTDPHDCPKYNKNHETFYLELAKSAMEKGAPCAKPSINETLCHLTYPCYRGDCPGAQAEMGSSGPASSDDTSNAVHVDICFIAVYVSVLTIIMLK